MRPIDADELKKNAFRVKDCVFEDELNEFVVSVNAIDHAQTVEPERPEGEWIKHIDNLFPEESTEECPFCHEEQRLVGNDDNFCPNCGAKLKMPY